VNDHINPLIRRTLAAWCLPDGTRPVITQRQSPPVTAANLAERRAEFRDECRVGMDCGPDTDTDPDDDDDDDIDGAPV
jgi:hypothetical protein